jgi:hypothetical protein
MSNFHNYWLVGANWSGQDLKEKFYSENYWEMGWSDDTQPAFASKIAQMQPNDRIAIKSMNGKGATTITIHAIGIITDVVGNGRVLVKWLLTDMGRHVPSRGSKGAFGSVHGPYEVADSWTKLVFHI